MQSLNLAADEFLVRLSFEHFVAAIDRDGTITGTSLPSGAMHFSYAEADRVAGRLRRRGYPHVHVEDVLGRPITLQQIENARISAASAAETKASLPNSMHDLDAIPARDRNKRYRADESFRVRVDEIYSKAGR